MIVALTLKKMSPFFIMFDLMKKNIDQDIFIDKCSFSLLMFLRLFLNLICFNLRMVLNKIPGIQTDYPNTFTFIVFNS